MADYSKDSSVARWKSIYRYGNQFLGLYCVSLLQSLAMPGSVHGPISILFGFCVILLLYMCVYGFPAFANQKSSRSASPTIYCQTAVFSIELTVENHVIVDGSSLGWTITIIQLWGREKKKDHQMEMAWACLPLGTLVVWWRALVLDSLRGRIGVMPVCNLCRTSKWTFIFSWKSFFTFLLQPERILRNR